MFKFIKKHDLKFDDNENKKFARNQNEKNNDNDVRIKKKIEIIKKIMNDYHFIVLNFVIL